MRKYWHIMAAFVVGGLVGWTMNGRPPSVAATCDHILISCPTGDGRRITVQLTIIPRKTDAIGDVVLGPDDWWIEIGGKAYVATPR